jgi:oligopeptidase B
VARLSFLDPTLRPPTAKRVPHSLEAHGKTRVDEYFWLRDREDVDTISYLGEENDYFQKVMEPLRPSQSELYQEMVSRIQETDLSVPIKRGNFFYYTRTEQGKQYRYYCRKQGSLEAQEELLLDANHLAEGKPFFRLGNFAVSPNHQLLAYSVDFDGDEIYTTKVLNLVKGEHLSDEIPDVYYGMEWSNDSNAFFYVTQDEAKRPFQVWRHDIGTTKDKDSLVLEEKDERFFVGVDKTSDERFLLFEAGSFVTTEISYLDANTLEGSLRVLLPRREEIEYSVDHHPANGGAWLIRINDQGPDFRLITFSSQAPTNAAWLELLPNRPGIMLEGLQSFKDYLVVAERDHGLEKLKIQDLGSKQWHEISFPEPTYTVSISGNAEFDSRVVRFQYQSLITPGSVFDYDMQTKDRTLLKQTLVLGGYDSSRYKSERLLVTADDGVQIPLSVVYRADLKLDGSAKGYLYGYGSYGASSDPYFDSDRLSLLDRGFVYAIAHIRGGGDLGKRWHDSAKKLSKKKTFSDFIACAEFLIDRKYVAADSLAAMGGSAGGMLMGAVANLRPDLFKLLVAHVPFVDVLNTSQDATLPLTVGEYEEWGNSNTPEIFDYIQSYSPYDNVSAKAYPNMFVTAGFNDPRVSYWEPAKWVAKLRASHTNNALLVLKTNMDAGHGGKSGRYEAIQEQAEEYAFVLAVLS